MKQIHNLYKLLILFCATFLAQNAVAQVSGNKYLMIDENSKVSTYGADITAKTLKESNASGYYNGISYAFDGNTGTWWASSRAGTINVDIDFYAYRTIRAFHFLSGGNTQEREDELHVYSSKNGYTWDFVESFAGDRTVQQHDYCLKNAINTRYLRLQIVPGRSDYALAMNEITLYSDVVDYSNVTIHHKAAKWFDLRSNISEAAKNMDTFNDETAWYSGPKGDIQASHVYMDTIYVHKGTSVTLAVPDRLSNSSVVSYQRWYSYRTDGTFRTQNTGSDEVWDLLTPAGTTPCRFANGYVGKPLTTSDVMDMKFYVPTDEEFKAWFGETAAQTFDNNYYLVGCDVSGYTDFTKSYSDASGSSSFYPSNQSDGLTYEPTLTHRIIYYIIAVDGRDTGEGATVTWQNGMGRLKNTAYQGGTATGKYLEEYNISFPFTRISNNTKELVALSKDARSYAIPDAAIDDDNDVLNVKLVDNGSGITLATTSLSGTSRIIQFNYPNPNYSDGTEYVYANNSTATIYVTKTVDGTTYNIAKYNLTFVRDTRLLTQTQLEQIENGTIQDSNLKYYQFRTDKYLSENYQLLTKLDFDYDPSVSELYGQPDFYQFPLDWTSSSYSFYDGADGTDFKGQSGYFPEWGYYSIMNGFIEDKYWTSGTLNHAGKLLPNSTYHMFIDASDRAGVIARLPFEQKLCSGSEMFVTAWVKSAGYSPTTPDAGMLFSVMGVKKDEATGQDVYVPIYRHASSQIRRTDYLTGGMPGTGTGTNEWLQMYFSFIVENDALYDSYVLQVDNNSESTQGGDMYIDDIRVYLATPSAEVKQLEATCTNERTMMSIKLDWDRLLSRLGEKEGTDKIDAIDFCFIDKAKYEDYLAQHGGDYEGAIENSVVEIGNNNPDLGGDHYNQKYNTLYFNLNFDSNTDYDLLPHPRLARDNGDGTGKYYFYRTTDEAGTKSLAVDFYSALTPNRSYLMLIQVNDGNQATAADFAEDIDDPCGINTPFYVTAQTLLRVNGEVVDPTTDFCAGQIFNFSAQMRVPVSEDDGTESYVIIDKGVYFDWFFGTEDEFLAENPNYGNVTLLSALTTFRDIYPDKEDLTNVTAGDHETIDGQTVNLSQDMINIINYYVTYKIVEGGIHARLVLHKENLDITLLKSGLQLVIQPIPTLQSPGGSISDDMWAKVCWSYIPLELNASGDAPQLRAGFNAVKYPADDFNPGLRIGLSQIESTSVNQPIKVNLRGAHVVSEGASYIGMITSTSPDAYSKIYLVDTDDPGYKNDNYFPADFSEYSLPIGTLKSLRAEEYDDQSSFEDYMEIYFDTQTTQANGFRFQPKEGYTYTFAVHFEEHGDNTTNACFGKFTVDMKVVPENLVWNGTGATSNWNNDANWKRADKSALKKADGDSYPTNEANTTANGFVPMLFSNVIMPAGSRAELYMAGYGDGGNGWVSTSRPSYMELPTENIQYDLMAYESNGALTTQRYRVNICNDIHFESGAQMLHAEQLLYNKAWTDVEITPGQWTAVSTPLQGVVAGDWYAPTATGRQETEYFKDITFNTTDYSRLNPAVYQRSWSTGANIVENLQGTNTPVSFTTEWSSAYNDASVPYVAGGGFSIKSVASNSSLLFRFPKADASYDVSTGTLNRDNAGKLLVSNMVDRSNPLQYVHPDVVSATLTPSVDGKYLMVGNPFMAPLDVQAFVAANSDVLAQKYWINSYLTTAAVTYDESSEKWSESTSLIAPYSVFYVEALGKETEDGTGTTYDANVTVKFTSAMQQFETTSTDDSSQATSLKITAEDAEGSSSAAVRYAASASNGFGMEDAQMISGLTGNADNAPKVYTVAGNTAVSVNQLKDAQRIPLGVTAADGSVVTLTFSGVAAVKDAAIYDAELQSETPLYEGYQLTVNGPSYGRYFLIGHGSGTTGITETGADGNVSVSSIVPRQVVVTSDTGLHSVSIWSAGGALLKKVTPEGNYTCTINGVNSGIVIVRTDTATGSQVNKIRVR
ncbi:discoidin domain-containing protein [Prevotella sp.]|uniref:discoidin domain-containing protein n=1 Tax=Prevotella sp. TaxID=59823 RepID=UPI003AB8B810